MKLLFDENLSRKLVALLSAEYPGSVHVRDAGLRGAPDERIWDYARDQNCIVVSKDDDFRQRGFVEGAPPKVVWLQVGNAGTAVVRSYFEMSEQGSSRSRMSPNRPCSSSRSFATWSDGAAAARALARFGTGVYGEGRRMAAAEPLLVTPE